MSSPIIDQLLSKSEILNPENLFWIPDRAFSAASKMHFKESRIRFSETLSSWPSHGVFESNEIASVFLRHLEQKQQKILRHPKASSWDLLFALSNITWTDYNLSRRFANFKASEKFWSIGKSTCAWTDVLAEIQQNKIDQLKEEAELILTWLEVENALQSKNLVSNSWTWVETFLAQELAPLEALEIAQIFFLDPSIKFKTLIVPLFCELRPLEKLLLRKLEGLLPVKVIKLNSAAPVPPLKWEELKPPPSNFKPNNAQLLWAFAENTPSPWELDSLLPLNVSLAAEFPSLTKNSATLSQKTFHCVEMALGYLKSAKNPKHPFAKDSQFKSELQRLDLNINEPNTRHDFERLFNHLNINIDSEVLDTLFKHFTAWDIFETLSDCGVIEVAHPSTPLPSRFKKDGVPLHTLSDLSCGFYEHNFLWSNKKAFSEIQNYLSPYNLKRQEYSASLRKIFAAEGIALPQISEEVEILKSLLHIKKDSLFALESRVEARLNLRAPPVFESSKDSTRFSPSAVEAITKCPAKYYLERELRLDSFGFWDPEQIDSLSLGSWVHYVLEKYLENPSWSEPETQILSLFKGSLNTFFPERVSDSYKQLLITKARVLAAKLSLHMLNFEKPFQELCLPEKRWIESAFDISRQNRKFVGKIDRVDFVNTTDFFVWDYKTGVTTGTPQNQIKKGKVQLWSYVYAVKSQMPNFNFLGGGYLNPLASEKSSLFLSEGLAGPLRLSLEALFESQGHPYKVLATQDLVALLDQTEERLKAVELVLDGKSFRPRPDSQAECARCSVSSVCGRPFLIEDSQETPFEGEL